MDKKRIVITGVGVAAANGIGKDAFWNALEQGASGIKPVSLFDTAEFKTRLAGEIKDFNAKVYLGERGLRLLDRSTLLVNVAAKLALEDCGYRVTPENTDDIGVCVGTTLGSLKSISDFDLTFLREGFRAVNPALFPNTVINSPASQVSIRFGIMGFNTTVATGFTSSLDALKYACDFIQWGRVHIVLVGGVEELCWQTYLGFHTLNFLAGCREGGIELCCPFDRRRNGIVFGEGSGMFAIEDYEHAVARGAKIYAEVKSIGYSFFPFRIAKYHGLGTGLREAMHLALDEAQLEPSEIDVICANANSTQAADKIEAEAIADVFGESARAIPVSAIKSMVGETFSASGAMQLGAGVGFLERQFVAPTLNCHEPDPACSLDCVPDTARKKEIQNLLISCFGPSGVNTCVVLSKVKN